MKTIATISIAPVKGFRLLHPQEVELTEHGVVENRRFLLVDADGARLRSSLTPWPVRVEGTWDAAREHLWMRFPDGEELEGSALELGETVRPTISGGRQIEARVVEGPWNERLTALAGKAVRVVRPAGPGAVFEFPVTLVSEASVERLAEEAGRAVDARRFRMLFTLGGCEPHEEDRWNGSLLRVGGAVLRAGGPVDRCAVTTRDPETGARDLDTLRLIKSYRGVRDGKDGKTIKNGKNGKNGKNIDFGVFASVEQPGRVRVGDAVEVV